MDANFAAGALRHIAEVCKGRGEPEALLRRIEQLAGMAADRLDPNQQAPPVEMPDESNTDEKLAAIWQELVRIKRCLRRRARDNSTKG